MTFHTHEYDKVREQRQADLLPSNVRLLWDQARTTIVLLPTAADQLRRREKRRQRKLPGALWKPATAYNRLRAFNLWVAMAIVIGLDPTDLEVLVTEHTIVQFLAGPMESLSGQTKALVLQHIFFFFDRVLHICRPGLMLASWRIQRVSPRKRIGARQKTTEVYRSFAIAMAPEMLPLETYTVETAREVRNAAACCIAVEGSTRIRELANLTIDNVTESGGVVTILVPKEFSKSGDPQARPMSPEVSRIILDYVQFARPLLLARNGEVLDDLWLTQVGTRLTQDGLCRSCFRVGMLEQSGHVANCTLFRRAMAKRKDIALHIKGLMLNHSHRSRVAVNVYAQPSRAEGHRLALAAWG